MWQTPSFRAGNCRVVTIREVKITLSNWTRFTCVPMWEAQTPITSSQLAYIQHASATSIYEQYSCQSWHIEMQTSRKIWLNQPVELLKAIFIDGETQKYLLFTRQSEPNASDIFVSKLKHQLVLMHICNTSCCKCASIQVDVTQQLVLPDHTSPFSATRWCG